MEKKTSKNIINNRFELVWETCLFGVVTLLIRSQKSLATENNYVYHLFTVYAAY